jgi:geranylgeranyl diphosphate synthase type I
LTNIGQLDDISQTLSNPPAYEDAMRRYQQKTSYYTFVDPITLGRTLAGETNVRLAAESFGIPAGMAFQLSDDILGLYGTPDTTGKSNLDDVREGKYTFLIHYALERANQEQRMRLEEILGNASANEGDLRIVQDIVTETGAYEQAQDDAKRYAEAAVEAARVWSNPFQSMLVYFGWQSSLGEAARAADIRRASGGIQCLKGCDCCCGRCACSVYFLL